MLDIGMNPSIPAYIMERIVEVNPSNISARFSLAYKHSMYENEDLALYHYLRIPSNERNAMTWNNLGVVFDKLSLPAKSVTAYRRARDMGETLAMSNLALKFKSVGFLSEAQEQCDEALAIEGYHRNIGHTLSGLKDLPDDEDKKKSDALKKAKPKRIKA